MPKIVFFILFVVTGSVAAQIQAPTFEWVKGFGGTSQDHIKDIEVDLDGNLYSTGDYSRFICFDDTNCLISVGNNASTDIFISKHDSLGDLVWAKSFGGNENDIVFDILLDSDENILLGGIFFKDITFDSLEIISPEWGGIFLAKISKDGNVISARSIVGDFYEVVKKMVLDSKENLWLAGHVTSSYLDFGDTIIFKTPQVRNEIFLAKISPEGRTLLVKQMPILDSSPRDIIALKQSEEDEIFLAGYFGDTLLVDKNVLSEGKLHHNFWVSFDSGGNVLGSQVFADLSISDIEVSVLGDLYILTKVERTTIINDTLIQGDNLLLLKYNTEKNLEWLTQASIAHDYHSDMIINKNQIYIAGSYYQPFELGGIRYELNANFGKPDIFLIRYDSDSGLLKWVKTVGSYTYDQIGFISTTLNGNVYISGQFSEEYTYIDSFKIVNSSFLENDIWIGRLGIDSFPKKIVPPPFPEIWKVYPNPFKDFLKITGKFGRGELAIQLIDINGKELSKKLIYTDSEFLQVEFNIPNLSPGIYFLRVSHNNKYQVFKLIHK